MAVDALGGDHAPGTVVEGAIAAVRDLPVSVQLVGPSSVIAAELARIVGRATPAYLSRISTVEAPDVIGMTESPLAALRRKPQATIKVAAERVARGEADALYSAGHTGATLLAAHGAFGLLPGAERPALAVLVPTVTGEAVLLDTGASLDCRPQHLVEFAVMGEAYARIVLGLDAPRVGLLSVGEEAGKGNELVREAHALLSAMPGLNFVGNLEARDFFSGQADVIVCDGFTGNIALKVGEGLVDTLGTLLRREMGQSVWTRLGASLARPAVHRLRRRVDAGEHGGAPLLGVNGLAMVGSTRHSQRYCPDGPSRRGWRRRTTSGCARWVTSCPNRCVCAEVRRLSC
ncbi:MAG: phosphate acyltransferase PlsX [Acidobacteria bacterium]|nr:phosphate acyltransferase PlsX [Acidobacteriota bacterium]